MAKQTWRHLIQHSFSPSAWSFNYLYLSILPAHSHPCFNHHSALLPILFFFCLLFLFWKLQYISILIVSILMTPWRELSFQIWKTRMPFNSSIQAGIVLHFTSKLSLVSGLKKLGYLFFKSNMIHHLIELRYSTEVPLTRHLKIAWILERQRDRKILRRNTAFTKILKWHFTFSLL